MTPGVGRDGHKKARVSLMLLDTGPEAFALPIQSESRQRAEAHADMLDNECRHIRVASTVASVLDWIESCEVSEAKNQAQ